MILRLEQGGPHNPVAGTLPRVPGSVRRTSTIDTSRPDGIDGLAVMTATARDLCTGAAGEAAVAGTATVAAVLDPRTRELESLSTAPVVPELAALLGISVASGFRSRVDAVAPDLAGEHSLLYLLLDDLVGAALVGGYAFLRADAMPAGEGRVREPTVDICAGWEDGSTMISTIRATGQTPTPMGPAAPEIVDPADPIGWHPFGAPGPHGTRRLRRIDVLPAGLDGLHRVAAFFRDSHWDEDGAETVIHEYSVEATIDPAEARIERIEAAPDVLPWMECPAAVGSASRLAGRTVGDLRQWVRREMTGTTTCTHLNDTLRSLADLGALLALQRTRS